MQQHPRVSGPRMVRRRRTQPALPGVTLPTTPIVVQSKRNTAFPQPLMKKRFHHARQAALKLLGLGLLLALLYLALYPLLTGSVVGNEATKQALFETFPWLPHLFWTSWASFLVQALNHIAVLKLGSGASSTPGNSGYANLLLVLLALA